jgi:hypothetical protein
MKNFVNIVVGAHSSWKVNLKKSSALMRKFLRSASDSGNGNSSTPDLVLVPYHIVLACTQSKLKAIASSLLLTMDIDDFVVSYVNLGQASKTSSHSSFELVSSQRLGNTRNSLAIDSKNLIESLSKSLLLSFSKLHVTFNERFVSRSNNQDTSVLMEVIMLKSQISINFHGQIKKPMKSQDRLSVACAVQEAEVILPRSIMKLYSFIESCDGFQS